MKEMWKPISNYEEFYEISSMGRIKSLRCNKILHPVLVNKPPYPAIRLHRNGKRKSYLIHRLVLEAFQGECPEGKEASHLNDIKTDNRLENLQWMTRSENHKLAYRNGCRLPPMLGKRHSKKTLKKMSAAKSEKNNPMYGRSHSKETKKKMSLAQKKRRRNERNS